MDSLLVTNYPLQMKGKQSVYPPLQTQPSGLNPSKPFIALNHTRLQPPNTGPSSVLTQTQIPSTKLTKTLEERKPAPLMKSERKISQPQPASKTTLPSPRKSSVRVDSRPTLAPQV